jgi:hypothetical protein
MKMIPYYGDYPHGSYFFAPTITRRVAGGIPFNQFSVMYRVLNFSLLARPYDTQCKDVKTARVDCMRQCFNRNMKVNSFKTSLVIIGREFDDDLDSYICRRKDLERNNVLDQNMTFISDFCAQECQTRACHVDTSTSTVVQALSGNDLDMKVTLLGHQEPEITVNTMPRLETSEFIVYICSCFGIWLGLSVIKLNPFRLMNDVCKKRRKKIEVCDVRSNRSSNQSKVQEENTRNSTMLKELDGNRKTTTSNRHTHFFPQYKDEKLAFYEGE